MRSDHIGMIITHTINANGDRRIYLGGKSSIECWIAPEPGSARWTFHMADAIGGVSLSQDDRRNAAAHVLGKLADMLGVTIDTIRGVPFDALAALHEDDPCLGRRIAAPRRRVVENGFTATAPGVVRPLVRVPTQDYQGTRRRR